MVRAKDLDAFGDGSMDDVQDFQESVKRRRKKLTAQGAIKPILMYLNQMVSVHNFEIARYQREGDKFRCGVAMERRKWAENMLLWIGRNV